jgi:hypothetical protein
MLLIGALMCAAALAVGVSTFMYHTTLARVTIYLPHAIAGAAAVMLLVGVFLIFRAQAKSREMSTSFQWNGQDSAFAVIDRKGGKHVSSKIVTLGRAEARMRAREQDLRNRRVGMQKMPRGAVRNRLAQNLNAAEIDEEEYQNEYYAKRR